MVTGSRFFQWITFGRVSSITDEVTGERYLTRYFVIGRPRVFGGGPAVDEYGRPLRGIPPRRRPSLLVHRIHVTDPVDGFHNHPWSWAVVLVVKGGYVERILDTDSGQVSAVRRRPLSIRVLRPDLLHRVELDDSESWSVVLRGPWQREWGYVLDAGSARWCDWRRYLEMRLRESSNKLGSSGDTHE